MRLHASSACAVEALESRTLFSTYMVTNHLDAGPGSLRADVQMSNSNSGPNTIAFAVTGTITLTTGQIEISNDLTIIGPGPGAVTISGGQQSRVFLVDAGKNVAISALTIANGRAAPGAMGLPGGNTSPNLTGGTGGAGGDGGGIDCLGSLMLSNVTIANNVAGTGGAGGTGGMQDVGFGVDYGNGGTGGTGGNGGGIFCAGTLTLINSTVQNNSAGAGGQGGGGYSDGPAGAGGSGGGIFAEGNTVITLSTMSANNGGAGGVTQYAPYGGAGGSGGGVYCSGLLSMANSTVAANATGFSGAYATTIGQGGGIDGIGGVHLNNVTVSGNSGRGGVGSGVSLQGDSILNNTIVAANAIDVEGSVNPDSAYDLIGNGTGMTGMLAANHNQIGTSSNPVNPLLALLGSYGGATQTMPPLPGSPAIDAGSNALAIGPDGQPLATDQRGMPRIVDATHSGTPTVDIGAVEIAPLPTTLLVTTTSDTLDENVEASNLSLRDALEIDQSLNVAVPISFQAGLSGTITMSKSLGPLQLLRAGGKITVQGPGQGMLTLLDPPDNGTPLLQVAGGVSAEFDSLKIAGGFQKMIDNSGNLVLGGCFLGGYVTTSFGAAPSGTISNTGSLTLDKCTCDQYSDFSNGGTLDLSDCAVGFNSQTDNTGSLSLTRCNFSDQYQLVNEAGGRLSMTGCNVTTYDINNYPPGVQNSGSATFTDSTISGNTTGISNSGTLALVDCTVGGNDAARTNGGGIYNAPAGSMTLTGCTIAGNTCSGATGPQILGGGIDNLGTLRMFNCTVSGNTATGSSSSDVLGGGIYNGGTLSLNNCTVANNTATAGNNATNDASGGGIYIATGQVTLNNTIVAANRDVNFPSVATADDVQGAVDSSSAHNLIGDADGASGFAAANHNQIGTAANPIDPKLGPLANNGGPTQTVALLAGSPAIDAGSNALAIGPDGKPLLTDQRGFYRIFNGTVDIGAYELGSPPLLPGDANADGKVDFSDLVLVARNYGMTNAAWADGDFNNDGSVGFDDLLIVARNYGRSISVAASNAATFSSSSIGAFASTSPATAAFDSAELPHHRRDHRIGTRP